jgi:hypothetical protein
MRTLGNAGSTLLEDALKYEPSPGEVPFSAERTARLS